MLIKHNNTPIRFKNSWQKMARINQPFLALSYTTQENTSKTYLTKEKTTTLSIWGCQRNNGR